MSEILEQNESQPVGQINYFNVLAVSIQNINNAIMNEKDPRDAAENFLTDLPDDWTAEIQESIDKANKDYNISVDAQNKILKLHVKESVKIQARNNIQIAGKKYSREIKKVIITLLKKKNLLFPTKKALENSKGFFSLMTGVEDIDNER